MWCLLSYLAICSQTTCNYSLINFNVDIHQTNDKQLMALIRLKCVYFWSYLLRIKYCRDSLWYVLKRLPICCNTTPTCKCWHTSQMTSNLGLIIAQSMAFIGNSKWYSACKDKLVIFFSFMPFFCHCTNLIF